MSDTHPSLPPDMHGAVNLDDPVQMLLTKFREASREKGAVAVVSVALLDNREVMLSLHVPHGSGQALWMLAVAGGLIAGQGMEKGQKEDG